MKKWLLLGAGALLVLAGWRPVPREPEGLGLVRALGVDGKGPVVLTAVCGGEDQEEPCWGRAAGEDFDAALENLPWSGEVELSLTSVSYIIVGRETDLRAVLLSALRNRELGASATVWLAEEGAGALLAQCQDPASGLELLTRRGAGAPTVVEALARLERGESLSLPLLSGEGPFLLDWEEWRSGS